jgi:hypothetical protein
MALGPRDTQSLVMLDGWDATELSNFRLQDGTTYAAVAAQLNAAIGALSTEIYSHPLYSALVSYTDQPDTEYRQGTSNGMGRFTEYSRPDAQRADTTGHMLPLYDWDRGLGWTWKYLRKARMSQVEADIADAIKDVRDRYRIQILTRLLKRGDDAIGSAGESPGFATAAASTGVDFTPPTVAGTVFDSNHEHYVGITGGAPTLAMFQDAKDEIREHGHEGDLDYIIGPVHETAVRALTGFVAVDSAYVEYGALQDRVRFGNTSVAAGVYPIGAIEDFRVWVVRGMPQYYGFAWKSYGMNSQRNPLRIRLDKGATRPSVLAMTDPRAGNGTTPLQFLMLYTEFGVGVGDRTNGTPRYFNSATWSDGTPT